MKNPQLELNFSKKDTTVYEDENGKLNWGLITDDFLKAFNKLPILYEINGFELRDIKELNRDENYIDYFLSNYFDAIFNHFEKIWGNNSVNGKIEIECYANNFLSIEEFDTRLKECFLEYDDEDNELYGNELFEKYPSETKKLLDDMGDIIKIVWDESYNFLQEYVFFTKSLFISFWMNEYSIPYKDWIKIEKIISSVKLKK